MSVDCVTLPAEQVAAVVEAVIAGTTTETAAADVGLDPTDLADAVALYRAAGLVALHRRQERAWFQVRVAPVDWASAEAVFATQVAPRLNQLGHGQATWWFLRKHPYWRLRIHTTERDPITALLDDLAAAGAIDHWQPGIYEPESAAFGGHVGVHIVHDLFCADSRGVLAYARQPTPQLGRRELSLLLVQALHQHAGLDWFEAADVHDRITRMRPTPADASRVRDLAARLRPLLALPIGADHALFAPGGALAYAAPWLAGFIRAGQKLRDAASTGRLDRGLRAILAHIVIFHWNRLGLSGPTQGILAHAAKTAILPRS